MPPAPHLTQQLAPNFWRFTELMDGAPHVDAYLLVGSRRAALIDALQFTHTPSLVDEVRRCTQLPVDVLLTHGHPDHAGEEVPRLAQAEGFTLYMSHLDVPLAQRMFAPDYTASMFRDLQEGDRFELGGITLKALRVAGHTPGSFVFLDRAGRRAFTGDSLGLWLQMDHSLPMAVYVQELQRFRDAIADIPDTVFYTGHLAQCGGTLWTISYCNEMLDLCRRILDGSYAGEPVAVPPEQEGTFFAELMRGARRGVNGRVQNLIYRDTNLR